MAVVAAAVAFAASSGPALAIANPASVFCIQSGGTELVLRDASGGEVGICVLPGGEMVEEWAFFRAHSPPPASPR